MRQGKAQVSGPDVLSRLGRFPWPRALMARGLERISAARPKVITLDGLYSEPTMQADDQALAAASGERAKPHPYVPL